MTLTYFRTLFTHNEVILSSICNHYLADNNVELAVLCAYSLCLTVVGEIGSTCAGELSTVVSIVLIIPLKLSLPIRPDSKELSSSPKSPPRMSVEFLPLIAPCIPPSGFSFVFGVAVVARALVRLELW